MKSKPVAKNKAKVIIYRKDENFAAAKRINI